MRIDKKNRLQVVLAGVLVVAPACGGSGRPSGTTPITTPITTQPGPTPTPTPANAGCALGPGTSNADCSFAASELHDLVDTAIDMLVDEKPQLLDLGAQSPAGSGQYRVVDVEGYLDTLVANLRRLSACAERDADSGGQRRVLVKTSNDFSEGYDPISSSGFMRRARNGYAKTCSPAAFPFARTADMPPIGSGCGVPYPPPISRFNCKEHLRAPEFYTVDATPIVGPNSEYCARVGFTDGRSLCPVRAEGWEDREACENWRVGRARDTGRHGPTWTRSDGGACTGPESNCSNDPDNQYQVRVYTSGVVKATAENGADCTLQVDR
jgi:hypothetical protein